MRPGDTRHVRILVLDAAGAAVTGLVKGDFSISTKKFPDGGSAWEAWSAAETVTEEGSGFYQVAFTLPSATAEWDFWIRHTSYDVLDGHYQGAMDNYDFDYLYSRIIRPVATLTTDFSLGAEIAMALVANRHQTKTLTVNDDNGDPVHLATDYTLATFILCIANEDQSKLWQYRQNGANFEEKIDAGSWATLANGQIAVDDLGNFSITFPEDCDFFDQVTASDRPQESGLHYDVRADLSTGAANRTVAIIRSSTLTIYVSEGPAAP
jgi:hypothetical protein